MKAQAKAAAVLIKQQEDKILPFFELKVADVVSSGHMKSMLVHNDLSKVTELDCELPCILKTCKLCQDWAATPKVQLALSNFGGTYKKRPGFANDRKVQMNMYAKEGREETQKVVADISKKFSACKVVDPKGTVCETPCQNMWLFGYDKDLQSVGASPKWARWHIHARCGLD